MALSSSSLSLVELINDGRKNPYNIKDCSMLTQIGDSKLCVGGTIFDSYIDFIKDKCVKIKLTQDEQYTYRYKPKKLSLVLYGTEELWFLLLRLNNIGSEIDFKPKKIYVLDPSKLEILNKILIINEDYINDNHLELNI